MDILASNVTATSPAIVEQTPKRIGPTQLTNSGTTTLYTLASKKTFHLTNFTICNTALAAVAASIWIVATGGTAANTNALIKSISIPANGVLTWSADIGDIPLTAAGDTIQGQASAATSLTFTGGGYET